MNNLECPICGKEKKRPKDLVCSECYKTYTGQAGKVLAHEGRIISFPEWMKEKAKKRLQYLQALRDEKKAEYSALQEEVNKEAFSSLKETLGGKTVPKEVFIKALREIKNKLWGKKGGNKLHFEKKQLEEKVTFLVGFLSGFQEKSQASPEDLPPESKENSELKKTDDSPEFSEITNSEGESSA